MAPEHAPSLGIRLPLVAGLTPQNLLQTCQSAIELGFTSLWVGDHVVLPDSTSSPYPHTGDGLQPFDPDSAWLDPLLTLGWLAGQLPDVRIGTSVIVFTLRNPILLAKQISSLSWLTRSSLSLGVGTGWLRDEYDAVGMPFDGRGTRAQRDLDQIRTLITEGRYHLPRGENDATPAGTHFTMFPTAPAPVDFLWGGLSPLALKIVATQCDGWLPSKQSFDQLTDRLTRLRAACDVAERDFNALRLVAKPGPGPDPESGAITRSNLERYGELGFHEVVLELPLQPAHPSDLLRVLERTAARAL